MTDTLKVALDVGNHSIKAYTDQADPIIIRSLITLLNEGISNKRPGRTDSPLVQVMCKHRHLLAHLGTQARMYNTLCLPIVSNDKLDPTIYLPALFAVLQGGIDADLDLHVSLPSIERDGQRLRDMLDGNSYTGYTNGQSTKFKVAKLTLYREGLPAYRYAQSLGLVPTTGYTALVDVGGGTLNVSIYDPDGIQVGEPFSKNDYGSIAVARLLAQDSRLKATVGDELNLDLLMDGLCGDYQYGHTGVSFERYVTPYVKSWFSAKWGMLGSTLAPYKTQIVRYIFVGGSSNLLEPILRDVPMVTVVPQPHLANVRGLAL